MARATLGAFRWCLTVLGECPTERGLRHGGRGHSITGIIKLKSPFSHRLFYHCGVVLLAQRHVIRGDTNSVS